VVTDVGGNGHGAHRRHRQSTSSDLAADFFPGVLSTTSEATMAARWVPAETNSRRGGGGRAFSLPADA
jgi:hypothetical protein